MIANAPVVAEMRAGTRMQVIMTHRRLRATESSPDRESQALILF